MRQSSISAALLAEIKSQGHSNGALHFDSPKLRYLSIEQAERWIDIGKSSNTHTRNNEIELTFKCLDRVLSSIYQPINIVDWGCGDGAKATKILQKLSADGCVLGKYIAMDVNPRLIGETIQRLSTSNPGTSIQFIGLNSEFENFTEISSDLYESFSKDEYVIHLLLGNTYNNFEPNKIVDILRSTTNRDNHVLLIGVKCRRTSSQQEALRIIREYCSYGTSFTFSFGHLLRLRDEDMERTIRYNYKKNRIEVWIEIKKPTRLMKTWLIQDIKKIRVLNSYKPTINEIKIHLAPFFRVKTFSNSDSTEVVLSCTKL